MYIRFQYVDTTPHKRNIFNLVMIFLHWIFNLHMFQEIDAKYFIIYYHYIKVETFDFRFLHMCFHRYRQQKIDKIRTKEVTLWC